MDRFFKRERKDIERIVNASARQAIKGLSGGKQTTSKWENYFHWYDGVVERNELRTKEVMDKLAIIRDINPDASMAIWNILRLANQGHEVEALTSNGKVHKGASNKLKEVAQSVGALYGGGADQLINVLLMCAFTQGAIALEVELNDEITDVVDFHAIDPFTLHYRKNKETNELQLIQYLSSGEYKVLNKEQVFYFPIDPEIGDPYGRSPMLPSLQSVMFQAGVLNDLKRVVHHQGYERFDIKVVEEAIIENMPDQIKSSGPEAISNYVNSYIRDVQAQMNELEPDDDFFHTDSIEIDTAGGAKGSMDAGRVIDVINQQIVTSLKQLPILLGRNEGTTETHGSIQWQIYVSGIESIQRSVKRVLERAYNVYLQVKGYPLHARVTFNELQANDRLKEAQADKAETDLKITQVKQGWITNDEAALDAVGHEAVDDPETPKEQNPFQREKRSDEPVKKSSINDRKESLEIEQNWVKDIEKSMSKAERAYARFLKKQRDSYIERLKEADEIPSRILADVGSLRSFMREEKPEPTPEFIAWVRVNILHDSDAQAEEIEQLSMEWITDTVLIAGTESLTDLDVDLDFNTEARDVLRWLSNRSTRTAELIQGVSDERVLMSLWDAVYDEAFTIQKAAEALQDEYSFSRSRAETIARTEIITAGRAGQFFGDQQSGMVIGKMWRSANQENTRDPHRSADGQIVRFDEPFIVNGESLMFPGDSSRGASGDNTINCRCWYKRILEGEEDLL